MFLELNFLFFVFGRCGRLKDKKITIYLKITSLLFNLRRLFTSIPIVNDTKTINNII